MSRFNLNGKPSTWSMFLIVSNILLFLTPEKRHHVNAFATRIAALHHPASKNMDVAFGGRCRNKGDVLCKAGFDGVDGGFDEEDGNEDSDSSKDEIEIMRRKLEETVGLGDSYGNTRESDSKSAPLQRLTTTAKERRKVEIELLQNLAYSDEPMNELWALWFVEKGPGPASQLLSTQDYFQAGIIDDEDSDTGSISKNKEFEESEYKLKEIINEYGTTVDGWAEPINRLATLYYLQGKYKESVAMCELVLDIKPWHFGCLSGIVLCYAQLGDRVNARMYASRRLPPLEATERREEWVDRAVSEAIRSMERYSLPIIASDDYVEVTDINKDLNDDTGKFFPDFDNGDAWQ